MPTYVSCKAKDFLAHMVKIFCCSLQARNVINTYIYDHYACSLLQHGIVFLMQQHIVLEFSIKQTQENFSIAKQIFTMYASFTPVTIDTAVWTDSIDKMARFISKAEATSLWAFVSIRPIFTIWKIEKVTDHIAEYP